MNSEGEEGHSNLLSSGLPPRSRLSDVANSWSISSAVITSNVHARMRITVTVRARARVRVYEEEGEGKGEDEGKG